MADDLENLTLWYLRRIDGRTDRVEHAQREHGERLATIERALARLLNEWPLDEKAW